ncbi:hypothetical protein AB0I99_24955 [Streptomyces spongiicola]|uniref:hypothetical protein n=1 Tax=Streptomyces spongiicola TaxID=1690221 RepID=UPI0033DDAD73
MPDQSPALSSMSDFATWEPVVRLVLADDADRRAARPARVAGRISQYGMSPAYPGSMSPTTRTAVEGIRRTLARGGAIKVRDQDHLPVAALANEIPALWDRPKITQTLLAGDLGPPIWPTVPHAS